MILNNCILWFQFQFQPRSKQLGKSKILDIVSLSLNLNLNHFTMHNTTTNTRFVKYQSGQLRDKCPKLKTLAKPKYQTVAFIARSKAGDKQVCTHIEEIILWLPALNFKMDKT